MEEQEREEFQKDFENAIAEMDRAVAALGEAYDGVGYTLVDFSRDSNRELPTGMFNWMILPLQRRWAEEVRPNLMKLLE